jgi:hypothetical protein
MDYIIRQANHREIQGMSKYAEEVIDLSLVKRKEDRAKLKAQGDCLDGLRHTWVRKVKSKNELIRYCQKDCGIVIHRYFTNDDLAYIEKNLGDFAQPGSVLWQKMYGNRTAEEVSGLKK